jgi:hypothetical protein
MQCSLHTVNDGVPSAAVQSTKFVESFDTFTGELTLLKTDRDDGYVSETLKISCSSLGNSRAVETEFTVEAYDECESVTIDRPYMASIDMPLGYALQMPDAYVKPVLRNAAGEPAEACGKNLALTAQLKTSRGRPIDDVLDVYAPDNWTVIRGKKLDSRREVQTTDISCISHLRAWAREEGWHAFAMKSDGTTVFYSKETEMVDSEDADSYLHIYAPTRAKQGLVRLRPTDKDKHVGDFTFALRACFNYLGGTGTTRQRCQSGGTVMVKVADKCDTATIQAPDLTSISLSADPLRTEEVSLADLENGSFPYSFTYEGSGNVGAVTVNNGCGPLSYTFAAGNEKTADASYMSLDGSVLTFAPTYDNALASDGKSVIKPRGTAKLDVTLSVGLADYKDASPATTTFEVGFGPSDTRKDCAHDELSLEQAADAWHTLHLGGVRTEHSIDVGIHQKVAGCDAFCSVVQVDSRNNEVDRTNELDLNLRKGKLTIGKDVYSQAEIGSVYTMKVDCGSGHETQFYLEIV